MINFAIAGFFILILCRLALRANARFRREERLPMQWWLNGDVTWSAPRPLALAFIPALGTCVLLIFAAASLHVPPRAGQEHLVIPAFLGLGAMFVAVQLLHIWLIRVTLRRNGR